MKRCIASPTSQPRCIREPSPPGEPPRRSFVSTVILPVVLTNHLPTWILLVMQTPTAISPVQPYYFLPPVSSPRLALMQTNARPRCENLITASASYWSGNVQRSGPKRPDSFSQNRIAYQLPGSKFDFLRPLSYLFLEARRISRPPPTGQIGGSMLDDKAADPCYSKLNRVVASIAKRRSLASIPTNPRSYSSCGEPRVRRKSQSSAKMPAEGRHAETNASA